MRPPDGLDSETELFLEIIEATLSEAEQTETQDQKNRRLSRERLLALMLGPGMQAPEEQLSAWLKDAL